jgi:DNA repair protein RecO (recombination protein O)
MRQIVSPAIILTRTDYGEADRILTLLTPEHGKLHLLAKGVRRVKSKLAGGIELFSISTITFMPGRSGGSGLGTLVSTRLDKHYGRIVQDLERTMLGYELIKQLNKTTEDQAEAEYFTLLQQAFRALDDPDVQLELVRFWFQAQLLRLAGHTPNLYTDDQGKKLQPDLAYDFNFEAMCFTPHEQGRFAAAHIKFLRLAFAGNQSQALNQVVGAEAILPAAATIVQQLVRLQP